MEMKRKLRFAGTLAAVLLVAACTSDRVPVEPDATPLLNASQNFNNAGQCMGDDAQDFPAFVDGFSSTTDPTDFNCTANDVRIARAFVTGSSTDGGTTIVPFDENNPPVCVGSEITLEITAELVLNAKSARSDIGLWLATDGTPSAEGGAMTGQCNHYNLINTQTGVSTTDGDQCGDLATQGGTTLIPLGLVTVPCVAGGPNGDQLAIASCIGWKIPGDEGFPNDADKGFCPAGANSDPVLVGNDQAGGFRAGTLPSNKSKCNCEPFILPITVAQDATLEVKKVCGYTTDPGKFNLRIDGVTEKADATCAGGAASTTGAIVVGAGTTKNPGAVHTFGETAGTGTNLANYSTSWECRLSGGAAGGKGSGTGVPVTQNVSVNPDENIVCTITNTGLANVTIRKLTVPAATAGTFAFANTFDNVGFNLTHNQTKVFSNVVAGTARTVTETLPDGTWDLTGRTCTGAATFSNSGSFGISVTPATGETIECTFTNTKRGTVTVHKTENGSGSHTWSFEVRNTGGLSGLWATGSVTGSGSVTLDCPGGNAQCNSVSNVGWLKPGGYAICEVGIPAGWTSTLPGSPYTPGIESDARCVDFTLAAAQTFSVTITNDPPPEGDQRTIGYWRNWSSCTKGNQYQKALDSGFELWTLDQNLPQTIGDLVVNNCEDGVNILSKRDLDGVNRASDAAYGLAAQLLAAKLNVSAGAGTCTAGNTAISQAQALLAAIDFDGTGSFLTSKDALSSGAYSTGTYRSVALSLANTLDQYNNGALCT